MDPYSVSQTAKMQKIIAFDNCQNRELRQFPPPGLPNFSTPAFLPCTLVEKFVLPRRGKAVLAPPRIGFRRPSIGASMSRSVPYLLCLCLLSFFSPVAFTKDKKKDLLKPDQ